MIGGRFAHFRAVAKEDLALCVFNHRSAKENFVFEAIVDFPVVVHGLRGEKGNVCMEVFYHIFRISSYQHGRVCGGNLSARRVGKNAILGQQRKSVNPVGDDADILEFL